MPNPNGDRAWLDACLAWVQSVSHGVAPLDAASMNDAGGWLRTSRRDGLHRPRKRPQASQPNGHASSNRFVAAFRPSQSDSHHSGAQIDRGVSASSSPAHCPRPSRDDDPGCPDTPAPNAGDASHPCLVLHHTRPLCNCCIAAGEGGGEGRGRWGMQSKNQQVRPPPSRSGSPNQSCPVASVEGTADGSAIVVSQPSGDGPCSWSRAREPDACGRSDDLLRCDRGWFVFWTLSASLESFVLPAERHDAPWSTPHAWILPATIEHEPRHRGRRDAPIGDTAGGGAGSAGEPSSTRRARSRAHSSPARVVQWAPMEASIAGLSLARVRSRSGEGRRRPVCGHRGRFEALPSSPMAEGASRVLLTLRRRVAVEIN